MTGLAVLIIANAAAAGLVFMAGHKRGRRSCRNEYPDGWDGGVAAERERWEQVTGATYERLAAEVASDVPDLPGNDGWPYLFTNLRAAGERREPPPFAEVIAAADTMLGKPPPDEYDITEEELEAAKTELVERYGAIPPSLQSVIDHGGRFTSPRREPAPPDVAEITDARPSGFARHEGDVRPELLDAFRRALAGDVPTVTGIVVTPRGPGPDPAADWDLLAGAALPDYAAAALGGQRTVDECVDSIVLRAVGR